MYRIRASSNFEPAVPENYQIVLNDDMSLHEAANSFLYENCVVNRKSQDSQDSYSAYLCLFLSFCNDNKIDWRTIVTSQITLFRDWMLTTPSAITGKINTNRTINLYLSVIGLFYDWACKRGFVFKNPIPKVHKVNQRSRGMLSYAAPQSTSTNPLLLKTFKRPTKCLTELEVKALRNTIGKKSTTSEVDLLLVDTAVSTGMRRKEVCNLTVKQLERATPPDRRSDRSASFLISETKGEKPREVRMPEGVYFRILNYIKISRRKLVQELKLKAEKKGKTFIEPDKVFLGKQGRSIQRGYLSKIMGKYFRSANIYGATFHALRHTFAVVTYKALVKSGDTQPWKAIQLLLGHAHLSTTINTYLETVGMEEIAISSTMEEFLDGALMAHG